MKKIVLVFLFFSVVDCSKNKNSCRISSREYISKAFPSSVEEIDVRVEEAKKAALNQINNLINSKEKSWSTVAASLDRLTDIIDVVENALEVLINVHPDEKIRKAAGIGSISLQEFFIENIKMNKALVDLFKDYSTNFAPKENLSITQKYFISQQLESFKNYGSDLTEEKQDQLKRLLKDEVSLAEQFTVNIADDIKTLKFKKDDLKGLSQHFIKTLKKVGPDFILKINKPNYLVVMENCAVSETRKKVYRAFNNRAYPKNKQVLTKLLNIRDDIAELLGFKDYAHLDLENNMAKNPETVYQFLNQVLIKSQVKEKKEFELWLKELPGSVQLTSEGKVEPWDVRYLKTQFKKKHLIDKNEVKEYFSLENVIKQMLFIYGKFFDLKFDFYESKNLWDKEVQIIEVHKKDDLLLGYVLLDLYPRDNKFSNACQFTVVSSIKNVSVSCPALTVVIANFPKSTAYEPSLLNLEDVELLFHEFGHAVHALLGRTELYTFSGINVKIDFLELPSQILENWLHDKDILKMVSKNYKTSKPLSDNQIDQVMQFVKFDSGERVTSYISNCLLSLDLHKSGHDKDLDGILKQDQETSNHIAFDPETHFWALFGHLPDYKASYYSYLWSEIFAKDIFAVIQKEGLLNPEAGKKYSDSVLLPGGSKDPNQLLFNYLGREPNQKAYFKALGF